MAEEARLAEEARIAEEEAAAAAAEAERLRMEQEKAEAEIARLEAEAEQARQLAEAEAVAKLEALEAEKQRLAEEAAAAQAAEEAQAAEAAAQAAAEAEVQAVEEEPAELTAQFEVNIIQEGEGPNIVQDQLVLVHYVGALTDGTIFDSSKERNKPFAFAAGAQKVIPCWDIAIMHMNVGSRAILTCPPELAYGEEGAGEIPANSVLKFDVLILDAKAPGWKPA